jgi:purine-binding chemotaxis protein CheW
MSKSDSLAEHQQALLSYLQDMLTESTDALQSNDKLPVSADEDWKLSPFQALLIDVQGLQLAIPEQQLQSIQLKPKLSVKMENNKPDWLIGSKQQLQIVDTGKIILPSEYQEKQNNSDFIIVISEGKWALDCNKINKVITLSPGLVKWRQQAGNRPWLAGTILEHKCGILNVNALIEQLEVETRNL